MDRPFRILLIGVARDQSAVPPNLGEDGGVPTVQALEIDPASLFEDNPDLPPMVDVAVFGSRVEKLLALADRYKRHSPRTQILFLVAPSELGNFKSSLPFIPSLADSATIAADAGADDLTALILDCALTARRRENYEALQDRINQQLSSIAVLSKTQHQRPVLSEQSIAAILKEADAPVLVLAPGGSMLAWNDAASELLGIIGDNVGRTVSDLFDPEARDAFAACLARARRGEKVTNARTTILSAGGEPVAAELNLSPILDDEGELAALTVSINDLSDRRRQEALEATMREAGDLEAVSHTLTVISESLDHIAQQVSDGDGSIPDYIETAREATRSAASLAHRLFVFSQRLFTEPVPVNANEVLESMGELIRRTVGEAVDVEVEAAPDIWLALCNPDHLETALLNLVVNARDAMPNGGRINIQTLNVTTEIEPARDGALPMLRDSVVISVADTGMGMTSQIAARACEPFFTTRTAARGLGLTQVLRFAKQAVGDVRIESEPGRGTSIQVVLPRYGAIREDSSLA